ncbi:MAG TPA: hypothetical protein VGF48_22405 [Thermoanaerobaculia bacterium]|jgi:hypothetical protein
MPTDPIVEEIHQTREELLKEHGGLDGYLEHLAEVGEKFKDRIVSHEPKRPTGTNRRVS